MGRKFIILIIGFLLFQSLVMAGGISTDAGLTPAQDRWIFRSQYRFMSMENGMMSMNTHMIPMVFAYGVTPGFSIMARGMYVNKSISTTPENVRGINDFYLLSKFRLLRINAPNYVLGIAPHIASNIPVGNENISKRTWNPEIGLNISFRPRFLSFDISTSYTFNDVLEKLNSNHSNQFNLNGAISGNIPFKNRSNQAISPVLEINYSAEGGNRNTNTTREEVLFLSPGLSYIHSSLAIEGLLQIPVTQTATGMAMQQKSRLIVGVKYMF